jgi:transposase-like protein
MKTQIHRAAHGRTHYSAEFRQEALEAWRKSGRTASAIGAELGIRPSLLYQWNKDERRAAGSGGPSRAPDLAELQAEVRRLTAENAKLLEQREVLKKSLGILSEMPPRGMPKSKP